MRKAKKFKVASSDPQYTTPPIGLEVTLQSETQKLQRYHIVSGRGCYMVLPLA